MIYRLLQTFKISFVLILSASFFVLSAYAQRVEDLSRVRVNELSDAQVRQFVNQVRATGLSEDQLAQVAAARGMQSSEVQKLKERVDKLNLPASSVSSTASELKVEDMGQTVQKLYPTAVDQAFHTLRKKVYGHELFYNAKPQFIPNLKIATPKSYVIGPGDEILLDIYGDSEVSYQLKVSPEGKINIPYVGVISVAGSSIDQLQARVRNSLSSVYSGISSGSTNVEITLGDIRSIQVVMAGELVQPGTYTLPSVATVFNALYAAGGPTEAGNLREVKVYRDGQLLVEMDVYDFLLNGSLKGNVTLQEQDIIQVSTSDRRVYIAGEVQRPMYYDIKKGDSFDDLLRYAGGFTDQAYRAQVSVERLTTRERRVEDILESQYSQFTLWAGDKFAVRKILSRFENRVQIEGAVYNPGTYELTTGLTLSMLIKKAEGIKEDAFLNLGYINRQKDNLELERINFNVAEVLAGTEGDILLKKEDVIHISSLFDLRDQYTLRIEGEVRRPGSFTFREGMTIEDLVLQAGGFKESASPKRIEVSRRVVGADPLDQTAKTAEIFHVDLEKDLASFRDRLKLQPFDFVTIRAQSGYESQKNVRIEGEVLFPGIYTLQSKDERISDLIERAGGLTSFSYPKGASLKRMGVQARNEVKSTGAISESEKFEERQERQEEAEFREQVEALTNEDSQVSESTSLQKSIHNDFVGVRIDEILKNESVRDNILLQEGDVIYVPRQLQTVRVSGEVLSPVNTVFREGAGFREYISQAGGYSPQALRRRAYIVYANGSARSTKSFLGIKSYPRVEPGAEIFVPQKPEREKLPPQAWVGLGTGIVSMVAIIVSLIK